MFDTNKTTDLLHVKDLKHLRVLLQSLFQKKSVGLSTQWIMEQSLQARYKFGAMDSNFKYCNIANWIELVPNWIMMK